MALGKLLVIHRSVKLRSSQESARPPSRAACGRAAIRWRSFSGVKGGIRPSGGSITKDVRRLGSLRSSRQYGKGDVPGRALVRSNTPACSSSISRGWLPGHCPSLLDSQTGAGPATNSATSAAAIARICATRSAYSSSLTNCRRPKTAGRSSCTPASPLFVNCPCRSGSPHGVRGGVHVSAVPGASAGWAEDAGA